jgi:hypothetical protein
VSYPHLGTRQEVRTVNLDHSLERTAVHANFHRELSTIVGERDKKLEILSSLAIDCHVFHDLSASPLLRSTVTRAALS